MLPIIDETGLLFVGDSKMSALATRAYIHKLNQNYLCPLAQIGDTAQEMETWVEAANNTWAFDFTVVNDWLFRQWYIFVVMQLKTRRIIHTGVTKYPTDEWTAQQLREATPWGKVPKYLIRDCDSKYATHF